METETKRFRTFEDLEVYRAAREFRKAKYAISRQLPDFEKYAPANQIRRAAVSVTNNIAEGHGRYHYLDQIRFALQARGSLQELLDDLNVCEDEHYLPSQEVSEQEQAGWRVYLLLNGYIRYLRNRKAGTSLTLQESSPAYGSIEDEDDDLLSAPPDSTIQQFNDSTVQPFDHSTSAR